MKKILIFLFVLAIILTPVAVTQAQGGFLDQIVPSCNENLVGNSFTDSCTICHIVQLIQNILSFLITISVMVATLMFLYAGFLYLTAGGSADKIKSATKIFTNVFIGLIFVLGAFLIVDTIMKVFYDSKLGPWNEIECGSPSSSNRASAPASGSGSVVSVSESNEIKIDDTDNIFTMYAEEDIFSDSDNRGDYEVIGKDKYGNEVRRYPDSSPDERILVLDETSPLPDNNFDEQFKKAIEEYSTDGFSETPQILGNVPNEELEEILDKYYPDYYGNSLEERLEGINEYERPSLRESFIGNVSNEELEEILDKYYPDNSGKTLEERLEGINEYERPSSLNNNFDEQFKESIKEYSTDDSDKTSQILGNVPDKELEEVLDRYYPDDSNKTLEERVEGINEYQRPQILGNVSNEELEEILNKYYPSVEISGEEYYSTDKNGNTYKIIW